MKSTLMEIRDFLVQEAQARLAEPPVFKEYTHNLEADQLLNDLQGNPHAFLLACLMDQQISAERAWSIPWKLSQRLGFFDFARLMATTREVFGTVMSKPAPLHRFPDKMAEYLRLAIQRIAERYNGNAACIWVGKPSSATVIRRLLEFKGMGQKKATMTTNILVRDFHVEMSDRYSIDISVDVQIRRVFSRLGFISEDAPPEYIVYRARELYPDYPGIFDGLLWETGRTVCHPRVPKCAKCQFSDLCTYGISRA